MKYIKVVLAGLLGVSQTASGQSFPLTTNLSQPPAGFDSVRSGIARGTVQAVQVASSVDGGTYRMNVYLPPNYSPTATYPVMYMLHGASGNSNTWVNDISAPTILDNLYADGKITPKIVVMPSRLTDAAYATTPTAQNSLFEQILIRDMVPYVQSNYAASTDRTDRTLAGLSLGGGQAMDIGLGRSDVFSNVGAFSGANTRRIDGANTVDTTSPGRAYNLFWLSTGNNDRVTGSGVVAADQTLTNEPIPHSFYITAGAHEPIVWKTDLYYFSQAIQPVLTEASWKLTGGGNYYANASWQSAGVPTGVGSIANFGPSITAASTVNIASDVTAGQIRFNNANAYTLSGSGAVRFDAASSNASVSVAAGNHTLANAVTLVDSLDVTTTSGTSLILSGPLTFSTGAQLTATGTGRVRVASATVVGAAGAVIRVNGGVLEIASDVGPAVDLRADAGTLSIETSGRTRSLAVASQATLVDRPTTTTLKTPTLTVTPGGVVDIADNVVLVDYDGSNSPITELTALVASGRTPAGTWGGAGIRSSVAAADLKRAVAAVEATSTSSTTSFNGVSLDSTTVILALTFLGDANLDRSVNFTDLLSLAQNYGKPTSAFWAQGDFNYDGAVNFADLLALAQNYGSSEQGTANALDAAFASDWALAQSLVPEPAAAMSLAVAALAARRQRERGHAASSKA